MATYPGTFKHGIVGYDVRKCRCDVCREAKKKSRSRRIERLKGTEPPEHGTPQSYSVYGCRCKICSDARSRYRKKYEDRLSGTEPPEHGLTGYRVYKCRCDVCVQARRDNDAKRMERPDIYAKEKERGWTKYGIVGFTYEGYLRMFEEQQGKCAICDRKIEIRSRKKSEVANVDHDHKTGRARGLLCNGCNKMIGYGRKPSVLRMGADYLERHNPGGMS